METSNFDISKIFIIIFVFIYWIMPDLFPGPIDDIILLMYCLGNR